MSGVPTTSPLRPIQSDYDDDKDEYKPDASEGYSSVGSVYIDEDPDSNDGSDEQENGDITDDNSDFEEEDGLSQDGRNDEDDADEGDLTEISEFEKEVETPAPFNKTGGRKLQTAPSFANKTSVSPSVSVASTGPALRLGYPVEILVDRLRINRSLAREALAELEQMGVIKKIVGHHKLNMYSTFQILSGRNKSTEADYLCSSERLSLPSRGCVDCVWEKCSVFLHTLRIM
jgi:hypothetical protein